MFSATSAASISGLRTSTMLRCSSDLVNCASFLRSTSMSAPFLPMMTPGRAAWIVTRHFLCGRSITTRLMPACAAFFLMKSRIAEILVQELAVLVRRRRTSGCPRCG